MSTVVVVRFLFSNHQVKSNRETYSKSISQGRVHNNSNKHSHTNLQTNQPTNQFHNGNKTDTHTSTKPLAQTMGCLFSRRVDSNEKIPLIEDIESEQTSSEGVSSTAGSPVVEHSENKERSEKDLKNNFVPRHYSFQSPPNVNNFENTLKMYRNVREIDRHDSYRDLYTEVDVPLESLSESIVQELAARVRVSNERARAAILQNHLLVRDAFSQILTEKLQCIMDETGVNIHTARKALCENNNDEVKAIAYCKDINLLVEVGGVNRSRALYMYYKHGCNAQEAKKELVLERFLSVQNKVTNKEEAVQILQKFDYSIDEALKSMQTGLSGDVSELCDRSTDIIEMEKLNATERTLVLT
jgi:NACalpha-BTF3-like transcription factor